MAECTKSMIEGWENHIAKEKSKQIEIEVNNYFEELTADIISHTAFGSSYIKGKEVFSAQKELPNLTFASILNVQIPGFQYLPTKNNRKMWSLDKKFKSTAMQIIHERLASSNCGYGNDLLGLMLETCMTVGEENNKNRLSMDEIIDECKTFFFAGHETTSHLLT
ncbi:hypothetical protein LUZ61_001856 [Rhynchospora tenuis]|uniref:Cytochrome P450 n=1 Tax=Rhynchospora tenuis TaxID=198213 RepID=A0AAD5ZI08_9POAL|nr:hypothetical protein LUZ61_001856 [Rhynchospora tenuis]